MTQFEEILEFWFGDPHAAENRYEQRRKVWFAKNPEFDRDVRARFLPVYNQAIAGKLDHWKTIPLGCLALVILLDQFPRNMFRGEAQTFASDPQALAVAKGAIAQGFDGQLDPMQRVFLYLPFEHSERLEDQHKSVALFEMLNRSNPELGDTFDYAIRHQDVIARFGRFPHRNTILGRTSTPAEEIFLQQPGSSF